MKFIFYFAAANLERSDKWCKCEASLLSIVSYDFSIVPKSPL
jgi:hypothetical protein